MTNVEKISQLRNYLYSTLLPLINGDYVLLDIPYYSNPGDTLIWEGTEHLLSNCPYKCLHKTAEECFEFPRFDKNVVILLQGGGNWGDLWPRHQSFRKKIVAQYPENRIIVLPQSIYYEDIRNWEEDADILKGHNRLHLCLRDIPSYELVKKAGLSNVYLLPDMAFCIDLAKLYQFIRPSNGRIILVKREDSEKPDYNRLDINVNNSVLDVLDWPTMEAYDFVQMNFYRIYNRRRLFLQFVTNLYADKILRHHIVKKSVQFISQYDYVYTTRLHAAILSVLLNKPVTLIDNSYSKNLNFYKAWLSDLDTFVFQS